MSKRNKDKIKEQRRQPNRSYGIMKKLPSDIKEAVDVMLQTNHKYNEIADYIRDNAGINVDKSTISRYARQLDASLKEIRMAHENMRVIMDEVNRYPNFDSTESIVRLPAHRVLDVVHNTPPEQWGDIDPVEILDKTTRLCLH